MEVTLPRFHVGGFLVGLAPDAAADQVVAYLRRNWDRFAPVTPTPPEGYFTRAWWARALARARAQFHSGTAMHLFMFEGDEHGRVVGDLAYTNIIRVAFESCYLGYKLDRDHEGQGVMSSALRATNRYVFDELGLHRIMANHVPENTRSASLLRRLGFVVEGYARDYLHLDGRWRDHVLTSLTNEAWQPRS